MTTTGDRAAPARPRGARGVSLGTVAAAVLLGAWLSIAAFHPFTPAVPQPWLDGSWVAALGEAADRGLRWGPDVAFTYGPASTLVTAYFNAAYLPVTLPLLLATCLLFGASTALLAPPRGPLALAGTAAAAGAVAALSIGYPDSVFLVLPLAPFLLRLSRVRTGPVPALVAGATAVAVGMIGMSKTSFPLSAVPLFVLGDAAAVLRRRAPALTLPCALGFLLSDRVYGQNPADLPLFFRQQWEVVSGYSDAMALDGSRGELLAFLLAAAACILVAAGAEWRGAGGRTASRFAVPLGFAWVLLILFKAGFVRQDTHTLIAWHGLALAASLVAWARFRPRAAAAASLCAVAVAAAFGLAVVGPAADPAVRGGAVVAAAHRVFVAGPAAQLAAAFDLARDPSAFARARRAEKAAAWREIADSAPLPRLDGGVDVIPSRQSRLIASGLDYRPRSSFQEYSTYTPALIAANRAFLSGPRAPDWVLFGPESGFGSMTLDRRYPNLAEGALWLDLLALYRPERHIGDLLALRRRDVSAPLALGAARRSAVGFDEEVAVGPLPDGARAVFATVDVRPTLLGRLAAFLFRSPPLTLSARFADGHERVYQFVPGIGSSGFALSPTVNNATEFEALADGAPPPPDRVVTAFSLHAPPRMRALLQPAVAVTLQTVSGGGQAAPPAPDSAWSALSAAEGRAPDGADIGVVPPSLLAVPAAGLPRVELGFGLALADDAPPGAERLCFAIHPADGTARTLWRRCLDRAREADRGPQSVSLALPPGTSELALGTTCEAGCDEGMGGYWAPPPRR